MMIKAHKIRLHPTPEQASYFAQAAGTSRFVWNWALAEWNRQYDSGENPTAFKRKKQFNQIKREQFPWTWEVTKNASDQPFLDLGKAVTAFFEGRARRPKKAVNQAFSWRTISLNWVITASGSRSLAG
jgi:putative transposase